MDGADTSPLYGVGWCNLTIDIAANHHMCTLLLALGATRNLRRENQLPLQFFVARSSKRKMMASVLLLSLCGF